jgi:hypothetical protein
MPDFCCATEKQHLYPALFYFICIKIDCHKRGEYSVLELFKYHFIRIEVIGVW